MTRSVRKNVKLHSTDSQAQGLHSGYCYVTVESVQLYQSVRRQSTDTRERPHVP